MRELGLAYDDDHYVRKDERVRATRMKRTCSPAAPSHPIDMFNYTDRRTPAGTTRRLRTWPVARGEHWAVPAETGDLLGEGHRTSTWRDGIARIDWPYNWPCYPKLSALIGDA